MSRRDRRALLAGGGVILAAVLAVRVVPALVARYVALRARTAEQVETLERARWVLAAAPAIRDSFASTAAQLVALAPQLAASGGAAEAAATVTAELSVTAERAGLRIAAFNSVPGDTNIRAFAPVLVRGQFEGDAAALARFLRTVENARAVLLSVRSLHVFAADRMRREAGDEPLRVELVIEGWRLRVGRS